MPDGAWAIARRPSSRTLRRPGRLIHRVHLPDAVLARAAHGSPRQGRVSAQRWRCRRPSRPNPLEGAHGSARLPRRHQGALSKKSPSAASSAHRSGFSCHAWLRCGFAPALRCEHARCGSPAANASCSSSTASATWVSSSSPARVASSQQSRRAEDDRSHRGGREHARDDVAGFTVLDTPGHSPAASPTGPRPTACCSAVT